MNNIGKRPSRTLLYEEVVNDLYALIDKSQMKPGEKLPPERELTEKLGISRNVFLKAEALSIPIRERDAFCVRFRRKKA